MPIYALSSIHLLAENTEDIYLDWKMKSYFDSEIKYDLASCYENKNHFNYFQLSHMVAAFQELTELNLWFHFLDDIIFGICDQMNVFFF